MTLFKPLIVVFLVLGTGLPSLSSWAAQESAEETQESKSFRVLTELEAVTNLFEINDPNHNAALNLAVAPSYKVHPQWTLSALIVGSKELSGEQDFDISSSLLSARYSTPLSSNLIFSPAGTLIVPIGKRQREDQTLRAGFAIGPRFLFSFKDNESTFLRNLGGFYDLSYARYVHEFETNGSDLPNTRDSLSNWFHLEYALTDRLGLGLDFILASQWSYQGISKSSFILEQGISYGLLENWQVAVSHSNSGSTLSSNFQDSNISLFNERSSTLGFSTSYLF